MGEKKLDPKLRVWGTGLGDCDWKIADYYAAPNAKIFLLACSVSLDKKCLVLPNG